MLEKHPNIDVIYKYWNMPNLDGEATVDEIAKRDKYKHIKIIMATTEGTRDKVAKMISKGVKGYLVKPFRPDAVIKVVDKMIKIVKRERRGANV